MGDATHALVQPDLDVANDLLLPRSFPPETVLLDSPEPWSLVNQEFFSSLDSAIGSKLSIVTLAAIHVHERVGASLISGAGLGVFATHLDLPNDHSLGFYKGKMHVQGIHPPYAVTDCVFEGLSFTNNVRTTLVSPSSRLGPPTSSPRMG